MHCHQNNQDWLYLHNNMRVYAGIEMESEDGLSFRMQSDRSDSIALQNINITKAVGQNIQQLLLIVCM